VHPPEEMPFSVPWTDGIGTRGFVDSFVEYHLGMRRNWQLDNWTLELGVWAGGDPMGFQAMAARSFASTRTVGTMSWLGQRFQRQGHGTEMRSAVLELAFTGLGAVAARSGALESNPSSARVSEKLGYEPAGEGFHEPRGVRVREQKYRLTCERWESRDRIPVEIDGLEPCLPLFGL
jgi:RimJ/RimL family protein N-acetyltransferase